MFLILSYPLLSPAQKLSSLSGVDPAALTPLRNDLDAKLRPLRDFFTKLQNAATKHSIHPSVDVLTSIPILPEASPFKDPEAAVTVMSMARHEGVGFSADFQTRSGVPVGMPASPLVALKAAAEGEEDEGDDDDEVREADLVPYAGGEVEEEEGEEEVDDTLQMLAAMGSDAAGVGLNVSDGLRALKAIPGNQKCSECRCPNPTWASVNLGVLFCLRCSGIHRRLGVHITQVRSLTLDTWKAAWVARCLRVGNTKAAAFWEANMPADVRPNAASSMEDVEVFLRKKYEQRQWALAGPSPDEAIIAGVTGGPAKAKRPPKPPRRDAAPAPGAATPSGATPGVSTPVVATPAASTPSDADPLGLFDPFGEGSTPAPPSLPVSAQRSPTNSADDFDPFASSATMHARPLPAPTPSFTSAVYGSQWGAPGVTAYRPGLPAMPLAPPPPPTAAVALAIPPGTSAWPSDGPVEFPGQSPALAPPARSPALPAAVSPAGAGPTRTPVPLGPGGGVPLSVGPSPARPPASVSSSPYPGPAPTPPQRTLFPPGVPTPSPAFPPVSTPL